MPRTSTFVQIIGVTIHQSDSSELGFSRAKALRKNLIFITSQKHIFKNFSQSPDERTASTTDSPVSQKSPECLGGDTLLPQTPPRHLHCAVAPDPPCLGTTQHPLKGSPLTWAEELYICWDRETHLEDSEAMCNMPCILLLQVEQPAQP